MTPLGRAGNIQYTRHMWADWQLITTDGGRDFFKNWYNKTSQQLLISMTFD